MRPLAALGRDFLSSGWLNWTEAEPEEEHGESEEGADRVEKGIVGRGCAADDKGLVDFVEAGIASGDKPSGKAPGPAPAFAVAAEAAIEEEEKNKVFGEMGAFADQMVDEIEPIVTEVRKKPVDEGRENHGGMFGRKSIGREGEDEAGPEESGPPGANPRGEEEFVNSRLHFR